MGKIKKQFLTLLVFLFITISFAQISFGKNILSCQFRTGSCSVGEETLFYAHSSFYPPGFPSEVLSSPISLTTYGGFYSKPLCCKINGDSSLGNIKVQTIANSQDCPTGSNDLIYYTSSINSRIAYKKSPLFNGAYYSNKSCISLPSDFGSFDILVSNEDKSLLGYSCLYKSNDLESSLVSSCNATFNSGTQYKYTVWARLWQTTSSLVCNLDCTSKLDNRVYVDCGSKISACQGIPQQCDGALLDSWVSYNSTHEIKCNKAWNKFRPKVFSNAKINVRAIDKNTCPTLIKKEYPVFLDNQQVLMAIYVCSN